MRYRIHVLVLVVILLSVVYREHYFVDFETSDKSLYSKNGYERSLVYTGVIYNYKFIYFVVYVIMT